MSNELFYLTELSLEDFTKQNFLSYENCIQTITINKEEDEQKNLLFSFKKISNIDDKIKCKNTLKIFKKIIKKYNSLLAYSDNDFYNEKHEHINEINNLIINLGNYIYIDLLDYLLTKKGFFNDKVFISAGVINILNIKDSTKSEVILDKKCLNYKIFEILLLINNLSVDVIIQYNKNNIDINTLKTFLNKKINCHYLLHVDNIRPNVEKPIPPKTIIKREWMDNERVNNISLFILAILTLSFIICVTIGQ